jgi:RNA polymerase sigma-70 factor (sigma-E family)
MRRGRGGPPPDDLAAFYADQYDRVWGALALFTGDRRLAEELAQEAFVKTCQHWEKVRTMDAPGAWVHRVGINLAISRARRRRTELRVVQREAHDARTASVAADAGLGDAAVRAAVAALPDDERAVVVLRFHADLSVAAAAAALGVPEGTVKTRTRRALGRLRQAGLDATDELVEAEMGSDR